jgi:hypothetical protein
MLKSSHHERRRMNRDAAIQWLHHSVAAGSRYGGDYAAALKKSQGAAFWAPNTPASWRARPR